MIRESDLHKPVQTLLEDVSAQITAWRSQPIAAGYGLRLGLWCVNGMARSKNKVTPWSLILKATGPSVGGLHPVDWNYWRREACVYESTLLNNLPPGMKAPRCLGVEQKPDGAVWIWLENLGMEQAVDWTPAQYAQAGRVLGRFNGGYLREKQLPTAPWLNWDWLRRWLAREPNVERVSGLYHMPRVQRLYPSDVRQRYERLWAVQEKTLRRLDELPQTLCHMDASPTNLFYALNAQDQPQVTAIDWAYASIGPIGAELAALVFAQAAFLCRFELAALQASAAAAFEGYMLGLRDIGWQGDATVVRLGFEATSLLRFGLGMMPVGLSIVTDSQVDEWAEAQYGSSIDEMIAYWAEQARWMLVQFPE